MLREDNIAKLCLPTLQSSWTNIRLGNLNQFVLVHEKNIDKKATEWQNFKKELRLLEKQGIDSSFLPEIIIYFSIFVTFSYWLVNWIKHFKILKKKKVIWKEK
jgi:hypothetical protein